MKWTIETPDTMTVARGKGDARAEVSVDLTKLNAIVVADRFMHGITQTVADAAADAPRTACGDEAWQKMSRKARKEWTAKNPKKIAEATKSLMQKKKDALEANILQRKRGSVEDLGFGTEVNAMIVSLLRTTAKNADADAYKNATEPERRAMCVEIFHEGLSDESREAVVAMAREKVEEEARRAAELAKLAIDVKV